MQQDTRRYLSRNPSKRRDPIMSAGDSETGNAGMDGFTVRYREHQPERPNPRPVPEDSYRRDRRSDSSRYIEDFACGGLMTDSEAEMARRYGPTGDY